MSLKQRLFPGFETSNPFWIASAHFSDSHNAISGWIDYRPSVVVLKTMAEEQRVDLSAYRDRTLLEVEFHKDPVLGDIGKSLAQSYFTDGPKTLELMSLSDTRNLLRQAKSSLPETLTGASILMGENYERARSELAEADFFELNLKYSVRPKPSDRGKSFFEFHNEQYAKIIKNIDEFLEVFSDYPVFIKFTRELPWLVPCQEFGTLLKKISERVDHGGRVGIVIANTRQTRIPPSLIPENLFVKKEYRHVGEFSSGVLAGQHLFLETYNLIRNLRIEYSFDKVPIVATGGIVNIYAFLEMLRAGACAVQLCSAFQTYQYAYYPWLVQNAEALLAQSGHTDYSGFVHTVQKEGDYWLNKLRRKAGAISYGVQTRLKERFRNSRKELFRELAQKLKGEVMYVPPVPDFEHATSLVQSKGLLAVVDLELPSINTVTTDATPSEKTESQAGIFSALANVSSHWIANQLSDVGYVLKETIRSSDIVSQITSGQPWDIAFLPETHLDDLATKQLDKELQPVFLGIILNTFYNLYSFGAPQEIREVFHFPGMEAGWALQRLKSQAPFDSPRIKYQPLWTTQLVFNMLNPKKTSAFFAKDPLGQIYVEISKDSMTIPVLRTQVPLPIHVFGSKTFCRRDTINRLAKDLASARDEAVSPDGDRFQALLNRIAENYLPESLWERSV